MEKIRPKIAIVGAGIIGSALAMALAERGVQGILVYDPDLDGALSSTELNAGGVRATFSQPANILCSKISIDYFDQHSIDFGYRPCGYLWLHGAAKMAEVEHSFPRWEAAGWPYEVWDVTRIRSYAPFLDKTDDLVGAVFAPRDGLLNSNLLKLHYRERAKALGVVFVDRHLLRIASLENDGVDLTFQVLGSSPSLEEKTALYRSLEEPNSPILTGEVSVRADRVVNCAGPWAKEVARILGYDCPSHNVRRQISVFDCREVDLSKYGMIVDSSGVYFHPEGGSVIGGIVEREELPGQNFLYDGDDYFQEKIWSALAERSTKFESLRHKTGWSGLYEVSPDESAIIGEVKVNGLSGTGRIFESHSYSGHGIMHSYACAVALAEKMVDGKSELFDLDPFSGTRFESGRVLSETAVI
jgi:FAD-dependent oxidoreductase domain-containing protein 1